MITISKNEKNKEPKEFTFTVDWEDIEGYYDDTLEHFLKQPLPGFRKGAAPRKLIEKKYASTILHDTGLTCAYPLIVSALEEHDIQVGSPIEIKEISLSKGKEGLFVAHFYPLPHFDLPPYDTLTFNTKDSTEQIDILSTYLLEKTNIEIDAILVEQELAYSEDNSSSREAQWQESYKRVKLLMILEQIAQQEGITINEENIEERVKIIAQQNEMSISKLKALLIKNGAYARIGRFLQAEQVLAFITNQTPQE